MHDYNQTPTIALDPPKESAAPRPPVAADRTRRILGVRIADVTRHRAAELLEQMIRGHKGRTQSVFFVNAHTLNLAATNEPYRRVLNCADHVFGDGTGIRWAGRILGDPIADNVNGTDLTPELFRKAAGRGYRYYLLGADATTIGRAAEHAAGNFPGWKQVGHHHGYLSDPKVSAEVIRQINQAQPDLLLVGMGNPVQERWIHEHRDELKVPVCMAVGGLFDFWAQSVSRAPKWLRKLGHEWLWRLVQQPRDKAKRYLIGNPRFLIRVLRDKWARCRVDRNPPENTTLKGRRSLDGFPRIVQNP